MSTEDLAQQVATLLKGDAETAATEAVDLRMKELPSIVSKELEGLPEIVRREMDACLDGKCDAIAERLVAKLPEAVAPSLSGEDVTKAVKAAMEEGKHTFNVEGHTAHDILDCPTCKPIVINKLWENEEYRKNVMERICEDDACRESMSKMFADKGVGVKENGRTDKSWAEQRLEKIRARSTD